MWVTLNDRLLEREFFEMMGKALFLCQHFELTCKDIIMMFNLSKALSEKKFEFLSDEHLDYVDGLMTLFLGGSIKLLRKEFPGIVSDAEIIDIEKAKNSRNYICHESEKDLICSSFAPTDNKHEWKPDIEVLTAHFRNLAVGDYIVSRWAYEFYEKESGFFKVKDEYVEFLTTWLLKDY